MLGPSGPPKSTDGLANMFDEDTTRLAARRFMAGAVIGVIGGTALGMGESSRRGGARGNGWLARVRLVASVIS